MQRPALLRTAAPTALATLCLLAAAAPAHALLLPMRSLEDAWFPGSTEDIAVVSLSVLAEPAHEARMSGMLDAWAWDVEVVLHCRAIEDVLVPLAVVGAAEADSRMVWVNGAVQATPAITLHRDPAMPDFVFEGAERLDIACTPGAFVTVRVRQLNAARIDSYGMHFVALPLQTLGQFLDDIDVSHVQVRLDERPVGLQTTLGNVVRYDEPHSRLSWYVRHWEPSLVFEFSWLAPWTALQMVADVESCPDPWQVVQYMTASNLGALRNYIGGYDTSTVDFCANLPSVLHGAPFASQRAREQLAAISMQRYLPHLAQDVPLYEVNEAWNESLLSDVERMYVAGLRTLTP